MKIFKNFFYNFSYQIFLLIVPLITTPYINRVIGPHGVGINSYTSAIVIYFVLFGEIGLSMYGNREIAYVRDDRVKVTNTFWSIQLLRMITISISIIFYLFFAFFIAEKQNTVYYLLQGITLFGALFDISWFFQGVENFRVTVTRNMIIKLLSIIAIFTFVKSASDLGLYLGLTSLSILLGNFTLWPYLKRYIGKPDFKHLHIFKHLKPSLVLFVPQIATQVYMVLNRTMLGQLDTITSSGYYFDADQIVKIVMSVSTAIVTVMLPRVANTFAEGNTKKVRFYVYRSFGFVNFLSIPMMFGLAAISLKFAPWFFGDKFVSVGPLIMWESPVIMIIGWSAVLGTQYLLPTGDNKSFTLSVTAGAILNLILNVPFILMWGALGAVSATVISELLVAGYQLYVVKNEFDLKKLFLGYFKYFFSGIIMFIVVFMLNTNLKFNAFYLIFEVFVGAIIYIAMNVFLKAPVMMDIIKIGVKHLNGKNKG
ncbi:flippase [Fructilactobacillus frigidiflavus]|uniref:flippase n=1 Tax=Fructilactobacillus frigidiflavus TaxID=3242688 RepID=UPI0037563998